MYRDIAVLIFKLFGPLVRFIIQAPIRAYQTKQHLKNYKTVDPSECKTVLVIGASFTGLHLTKLLTQSLPTGYRVLVIEPSTHFNYTFNFPRYSVLAGSEHKAFIPYDPYFTTSPSGIYTRILGTVKHILPHSVELEDGRLIEYEFLALATGAKQSPPAKLLGRTKRDASAELQVLQGKVKEAESIALVGGGAVGVQIAGDIKTFFPEKRVVLIHSRERLLPNFDVKIHEYAVKKLEAMGVEVVLGERPVLPADTSKWESANLIFKSGREERFDLVIPCTGQTPNSQILAGFAPDCISPQNGRILVHPTMQLKSDLQKEDSETGKLSKIYALGDVAEANAPRMARAGMMQAEIVRENILRQIQGRKVLKRYEPLWAMEGILKLSLGKDENVTFVPDEGNGGYLFPGKATSNDLEVDRAWAWFGSDLSTSANLDV